VSKRERSVGSGAFKLYIYPPAVVVGGPSHGDALVNEQKLVQRIAPSSWPNFLTKPEGSEFRPA
jgi:hypothetical protein